MGVRDNAFSEIHDGESIIEGGFVYAVGNKPISGGHAKTCAHVGENRKLDAGFCVNGFQECVETNASAPTAQLQRIRAALALIACRKWNFRVIDVSWAFLGSVPLHRETYARLPGGVEKGNIARELLKPLYGLSTSCKDSCETIRDFLANECVCVGLLP